MQLSEAKEMYFLYIGNYYWMQREEPERFNEFHSLRIPETVRRQWDEEMIRDRLRNLWDEPDQVWRKHESMIMILRRRPPNMEELGSKLLDEMEHMPAKLDALSKIYVIENMAGQNTFLNDGGVCFFCSYTKLEKRMNEIMERLMDFPIDPETDKDGKLQDRLNRAKARYRESWQKWSHHE